MRQMEMEKCQVACHPSSYFSTSEVEETWEVQKSASSHCPGARIREEMCFRKGMKEELYQHSNVACWELCRGGREGRTLYFGDLPSL